MSAPKDETSRECRRRPRRWPPGCASQCVRHCEKRRLQKSSPQKAARCTAASGGCYRHVHGCDDLRYDNAHADDGSQQVQVPDVGCEWNLTNDHHDDGDGQYEHELHEGNVNERKCFFEALNACQNAGAAKRRKKDPKRRHGSVLRRAIVGVSSRILAQGRHKDTADPLHF